MNSHRTTNCICAHCGKPFFTKPSRIAAGKGKFCSTTCYYTAKPRPVSERFWKFVDKTGSVPANSALGACWLWTGTLSAYGYGRIDDQAAHRLAYSLSHGDPGELHVCHHCDNPPCVNPEHLFLGTNNDNRQDSVRKNRHAKGDRARAKNPERGEQRYNAKLTAESVRVLRMRCAAGESQRSIAISLGITQSLVSHVITGKSWKHVV